MTSIRHNDDDVELEKKEEKRTQNVDKQTNIQKKRIINKSSSLTIMLMNSNVNFYIAAIAARKKTLKNLNL